MKIIAMKKPTEKKKKDMFAVLCFLQFGLMVMIILLFSLFVRLNAESFAHITEDIGFIFEKDIDIGGYYVPSEDKTTRKYADPLSFEITGNNEGATQEVTEKTESETVCESGSDTSDDVFCEYMTDTPVMPVNGTLTSDYGYREHPVYSGENFHKGRDIAAAEGTAVHSVLDGTVTEAGTAEMAGNYIKIDHHNGYETLYCHCSELYVSAGTVVRRGDVIAAVGQTGLATGPHLHFELHENGCATDPEILLGDAVCVY